MSRRRNKKKNKKESLAPACVVVDLGSCSIKAGFAGLSTTSSWIPDVTVSTTTLPQQNKATMLGEIARQAWDRRDELIRPIKRGKIVNQDQLKLLLEHTLLNKLEVSPKKNHILFADAAGYGHYSANDRKILMEWTFEKLGMLSCMFIPQPVLGAFASGLTTSVVVDSGYESSSVTSVIDGSIEQKKVLRIDHDSQENMMLNMLLENERITTKEKDGLPLLSDVGPHCRLVAEGTCYCSLKDIHKEMNSSKAGRTKKKYQLPDGTWLPVSEERFMVPEVLFGSTFGNRWNPSSFSGISGLGSGGLGGAVAYQLKQHSNLYTDLSRNIICIGGRAETENFDERLDLEISNALNLLPRKKRSLDDENEDMDEDLNEDLLNGEGGEVKTDRLLRRPKMARNKSKSKKFQRSNAAWAGGAMIASIDSMRALWINKEEFEEMGADACIDRRRMG
jgi:actin-related protein